MLPNFASLPRYGTRASRAAATRSLGPDDSLTHGVLSLRVAGPRGAPRDAKEAGAKVYPRSHFPCGPGVPHESCEDSSRRAPKRRRRLLTRPRPRQRWAAPLNRAAGTPRAPHRQQISYYNNSTLSTRSTQLPGRLAARSIGCLYSTPAVQDSATPWRTPWPCSNRRKR